MKFGRRLRSSKTTWSGAAELSPIRITKARLAVSVVALDAARTTTLAEHATQPDFAESLLNLSDTLRRAGANHAQPMGDHLGRSSFLKRSRADRIVALDHGRVLGSGRHEELLAKGSAYGELEPEPADVGSASCEG